MFRVCFILFTITYFLTRISFAQQQTLKFGIHHQFEATRAMGMGNAFIAVADDENALFYNPAALKRLKESHFNMFIKGAGDPDILDIIDDFDEASDAADETAAFLDLINRNLNKNFGLRAPSLGMIYARPGWGFGIIPADVSVDISFQRRGFPVAEVKAIADTTIAYGKAWDFKKDVLGGRLSVGVTGKAINRVFLDKSLSAAQLIVNDDILDDSDAKEGFTVDADLGLLWTWDTKSSWVKDYNFAMVVRNALDLGYISNFELVAEGDNGDPEDLQRRVDLGGSIKLQRWWVWDTNFAFEVKDMLHDQWTFEKGYHIGLEFLWTMRSWWKGGWRVGLNQGHFTAGFTGQLSVFKLDLATYRNEIGTSSNLNNTRFYMFTASLDF